MRLRNRKLHRHVENLLVGEDWISKLHDHILHHILSFLEMKSAITTRILSKRWKMLWNSAPNLEFCCDSIIRHPLDDVPRFLNYVDAVLQNHDMSYLQKFVVHCEGRNFNVSRISRWISVLMEHKVPELHFHFVTSPKLVVPDCLFSSNSLRTLVLQVRTDITLPASISLPSLKTLHLYNINFMNSHYVEQLCSNSPVLERLIIDDCLWDNLKTFCISSTSLMYFTLEHCETVTEDDDEILAGREILVQAPNLTSFNRVSYLHYNSFLCKFQSLFHANIDVSNQYHLEWMLVGMGYRAIRLLEGLSCVQCLTISGNTFEYLLLEEDCLDHLPAFPYLTKLEISTAIPYRAYEALFHFLVISPNLELIIFAKGLSVDVIEEYDWSLEMVPPSSLLRLTEVVFLDCVGPLDDYMNALKFFFINARALGKISMQWRFQRFEHGAGEFADSEHVIGHSMWRLRRTFNQLTLEKLNTNV